MSAHHTLGRYSVRSLSPAFWYVYDAAKARRERGRGQVSRPYGSKAEAERAAIAKATEGPAPSAQGIAPAGGIGGDKP